MSAESKDFDPYDIVLADLRAKRSQIDQAILAIESVRGGLQSASSSQSVETSFPTAANQTFEAGALLGMSIAEAAKKILGVRRRQMNNAEILSEFRAGGFMMSSADPINTLGAVLTRRFKETGDIVRVDKGTWGLKEWYPGRTFAKSVRGNGDESKPSSAPAPPLELGPDAVQE